MQRTSQPGARYSPFAGAGLGVALASGAVVASISWRLAGDVLPGGSWPAVHVFTLGAVTPLIATFMPRFAAALLHARPARGQADQARTLFIAAGAALVIAGRLIPSTPLLAAGAFVLTAAVGWLYAVLRGVRRQALPARFGFIVRAYERACGAFLHGALLGALLGAGVIPGAWYGRVRIAHIQLMVLGWAGVPLLATIVMFGPAMMRARIEDGADAVAARALPRASTATTVAAFALMAMGAGGTAGMAARVVAGVSLGIFAWAVIQICAPVLRTARRAPSAARWFVAGACAWLILAALLNAGSVITATPAWTNAAIVALLTGGLLQAILASISYVIPLLTGRDAVQRSAASSTLAAIPQARAIALWTGAALVAVGTGFASGIGAHMARAGWTLVAAGVVLTIALCAMAMHGSRRVRL